MSKELSIREVEQTAFLPDLKENIRFGAKMIAMDQSPTDVTIHYQTAAGCFQETGDYAIITIPFPVLRYGCIMPGFRARLSRTCGRRFPFINPLKRFPSPVIALCRVFHEERGKG